MTQKKLPREAPCPCGSGRKYGDCCYDKGFEYLTDEAGNIFKSIPMSDELTDFIEKQKWKFQKQQGRNFGPNDKMFFDAPPLEHIEHFMVEAMKKAGLDPALIYAFEKTGLLVTEENQDLLPERDLAEWSAAIEEYEALQAGKEISEGDEDELF